MIDKRPVLPALTRIARIARIAGGARIAGVTVAAMIALTAVSAGATEPVLAWDDLFDGGGSYQDYVTCLLIDAGGNVVVGGETNDAATGSEMRVRLLDRETGDPLWTTTFVAPDASDMALYDMAWDGQGDLAVAGFVRGCEG